MNISRRDFLKGTVAGAASAAVMGVFGISAGAEEAKADGAAAGSGYAWTQPMVPITDFVAEENYDIVIVGAGMAGCTAAQAAAEAGASVCVVDQSNGFTAHGTDICGIGTKLQKEAGVEIDKALAARLLYQWSQSQANFALIRTFVEKSGEILDYYIDMARERGIEVNLSNQMTARTDWNELEDRFKQFSTAHKFAPIEQNNREDGKWVTANFIEMCEQDAIANGAVFHYETKAEQLVREGDKVTAVIVSDGEGYKKLNAAKGVILATGDISGNEDMMKEWCPMALRSDMNAYAPAGGNMGDGIVMGMQVGAQRSYCYPAPMIHPVNMAVMAPGFDTSWLTVNSDGERYCCEVGFEPIVTNARVMTPGNVAYAIMDSHYKEHAIRQEPIKSAAFVDGLEDAVEKAVENGQYYKGETLEELADAIGVPYEALQTTVERYNKWCDAGVDEDFGVPERFLSSVKDGPFYACNVNAWMLVLPYGLHVDENSQVCDEEDNPIGGLFAIGNVQGDFFANSYPVTCPGTSHGRCVTFGRLVGQALANDTVLNGYDALKNA